MTTQRQSATWTTMGLAVMLGLGGCMEAGPSEPGAAGAEDAAAAALGLDAGWQQIAPGVFELAHDDGQIEHYAVGRDGLSWALHNVEESGEVLRAAFERDPSQANLDNLDAHREVLGKLRAQIADADAGKADAADALALAGCNVAYGSSSTATRLNPGMRVNSSAYYNNTCSLVGNVYAYAYAEANGNWESSACGTQYGPNVSCSVTASKTGTDSCYGYGYAIAEDHNGNQLYRSTTLDGCGYIEPPDPCDLHPNLCCGIGLIPCDDVPIP